MIGEPHAVIISPQQNSHRMLVTLTVSVDFVEIMVSDKILMSELVFSDELTGKVSEHSAHLSTQSGTP
jgi:hypothetical protein